MYQLHASHTSQNQWGSVSLVGDYDGGQSKVTKNDWFCMGDINGFLHLIIHMVRKLHAAHTHLFLPQNPSSHLILPLCLFQDYPVLNNDAMELNDW